MKRIVVFQHVGHEILGTLHPLLRNAGFRIRYANFGRYPELNVDVDRYDGLVILGGPMGVYEQDRYPHLAEEMRCIREAIRADKPILGICLGAQLIAATLGAQVAPSPQKEIGWYEVALTSDGACDPVLGKLQKSEMIFQWHQDAFQLPDGAKLLASSPLCPHQAFRYGDKIYGFQFHLEVDQRMIERWLKIMPIDHDAQVRSETPHYIARLEELSRAVFSSYIDLFSSKRRKLVLGSGHR